MTTTVNKETIDTGRGAKKQECDCCGSDDLFVFDSGDSARTYWRCFDCGSEGDDRDLPRPVYPKHCWGCDNACKGINVGSNRPCPCRCH